MSCGLCQPTNEPENFEPGLIELFESFFGSLPGSKKPELFDYQPKNTKNDEKIEEIEETLEGEKTVIFEDSKPGLDNEIFGISQRRESIYII